MQAEAGDSFFFGHSSTQTIRDAGDPNRDRKADERMKVKRLKTRKERNVNTRLRVREDEPCGRHHGRREGRRPECRSLVQHLYRNTLSVHTSSGLEPCIITDGRLIGHQGLFNHEVKSIDVERLIDQCTITPGHMVAGKSNNPVSSRHRLCPVPGPSARMASTSVKQTEGRKQRREGQNHSKTQLAKACRSQSGDAVGRIFENAAVEASLGNDDKAGGCLPPGDPKSQGLSIIPGEKDVDPEILPTQLFTYKHPQLSTSDSYNGEVRNGCKLGSQAVELGHNSLQSSPAGKERERGLDKKNKSAVTWTPRRTTQPRSPVAKFKQLMEARLHFPESDSQKRFLGSNSMDERPTEQSGDFVSASLDAVALRLCWSLEMPLLHRRDLLSENREALLRVLQESHGAQLRENLFGLRQGLCCGAGEAEKACSPYKRFRDDVYLATPITASSHPESSGILTLSHGSPDPLRERLWSCSAIPKTPMRQRRQPHLPMPDLQKRQKTEFVPQLSLQEFQSRRIKEAWPSVHFAEFHKKQKRREYPQQAKACIFTEASLPNDTWNSNCSPFVKPTENDPDKPLGTDSPEFLMDFQPTFPLSPIPYVCGPHTGTELRLDAKSKRGAVKAAAAEENVWHWREACRMSATETGQEMSNGSGDAERWPPCSSMSEWSCLKESYCPPLRHSHSAVHRHSHCIPEISASVQRLNRSDTHYYPPSDWLTKGSPSQPSHHHSPDHWFFPRMRLY